MHLFRTGDLITDHDKLHKLSLNNSSTFSETCFATLSLSSIIWASSAEGFAAPHLSHSVLAAKFLAAPCRFTDVLVDTPELGLWHAAAIQTFPFRGLLPLVRRIPDTGSENMLDLDTPDKAQVSTSQDCAREGCWLSEPTLESQPGHSSSSASASSSSSVSSLCLTDYT